MNSPPRLALPVEEDVLPDWGKGGVGKGSSADCLNEPLVEDRGRRSGGDGPARMGEDVPESFCDICPGGWLGDARVEEDALPSWPMWKGRWTAVSGGNREGD